MKEQQQEGMFPGRGEEGRQAVKKILFDPECAALAKYFLKNAATNENISSLAETIQDAVEGWFIAEGLPND